ncbi:MAG: MATE family efflux transporter [Anaerolineae bacterium]|nr:MATE family efflux transporter [Anaerolineae bacterium]
MSSLETSSEALPTDTQNTKPLRIRVLNLAWPVIGENLLETMLGIVDVALVGVLGVSAIAGVGAAQQGLYLLISILAALSIGCAVLVAQAVGAKDLARAGRLARQSLLWSVVISVPLVAIGFIFSRPVCQHLWYECGGDRDRRGLFACDDGHRRGAGGVFIGSGVLRGAGDSRTPFIVTAIANIINVPLAYGLINGAFGLPNLGAVGSAWATFMARAVALVLLLMALWQGRNGVSIRQGLSWRLDLSVIKQVLTIGVPAAVEQILTTLAFTALTVLVGGLGTATLAAHRLVITITSFAFLPGFGFAIAATSLIGQAIGAKKFADIKPIARIAATWSAIWMGAIGLLLIAFAPLALRVFTDDQAVIDAGATALRVLGLVQAVWAVQFVYSGGLRGMGDTRSPLVLFAGGMWLSVGVAWLFLRLFQGGLVSVWSAFLITTPVIAGLMVWRFMQRVQQLK